MEARIVIDLRTNTPPFEQIQEQIASLIAVGKLTAGTRLPTVRSLAADLGVAAGTVARAYKELEAAGAVLSNRRQGTVVADSAAHLTQPDIGEVMAAVELLVKTAQSAGLDSETLVWMVKGRLAQD